MYVSLVKLLPLCVLRWLNIILTQPDQRGVHLSLFCRFRNSVCYRNNVMRYFPGKPLIAYVNIYVIRYTIPRVVIDNSAAHAYVHLRSYKYSGYTFPGKTLYPDRIKQKQSKQVNTVRYTIRYQNVNCIHL